jgi:hypothetical protein
MKQSLVVGVGIITLIVALLAIPPSDEKKTTEAGTTLPGAASISPSATVTASTSETEPDPLAANLRPGRSYGCEGFIVKNSLLKSLPKGKDLNARWIYDHDGASLAGTYVMTIQGKSKDAVIIDGLHVVDLKREAAPRDASVVLPCTPYGGGQEVRYFEVLLQKRPRVIPRPGEEPDEKGKVQPAAKFPFKVSRSDPEYFELLVSGPPCVCSWTLAVDWTSGDRSGTKIIDRKFSNIRTNTTYHNWELPFYWRDTDGTWEPPLPK